MSRATAFVFAAAICAHAGFAVADEGHARGLVRVYVAGPLEAVLRTRATVRELLARIQMDAVVEPASDEAVLADAASDGAARAFLDFRALSAPRVVLSQPGKGHDLVRRTLPASSSLEVSVEEAAHIVYAAVEASSEALAATVPADDADASSAPHDDTASATQNDTSTPSDAAASAPAPAPAKAERLAPAPAAAIQNRSAAATQDHAPEVAHAGSSAPVFDAAVSAFAGVSSFASDAVLPGAGGALDVAFGAARLRPGAMLSVGMFFPSNMSRGGESGSLHAESVRLLPLLEWTLWRRASFVLGAGAGVDRVTFEPGPSSAVAVSGGRASRYDPVLQGLGAFRFRFSDAFGAFVLAAADVDLTPHRYVTDTAGVTSTFFAVPRVRPTTLAGVIYVFHEAHAEASR